MICRHALVQLRYTHHTRRAISTTVRLCNRHEPLDTAAGSLDPVTQPLTDTLSDPTISDTLSGNFNKCLSKSNKKAFNLSFCQKTLKLPSK